MSPLENLTIFPCLFAAEAILTGDARGRDWLSEVDKGTTDRFGIVQRVQEYAVNYWRAV